MKPVELPPVDALRPGTRWTLGPGLTMTLHPGKHGPDDMRVEIHGDGAISHRGIALVLLAVMKAEERYLKQGGLGAVRFEAFINSVVYWFKAGPASFDESAGEAA